MLEFDHPSTHGGGLITCSTNSKRFFAMGHDACFKIRTNA